MAQRTIVAVDGVGSAVQRDVLAVAAKLTDADGEVLETAVTRIDLLDAYWRERMYRDDVTRLSILRSVVERMVSSRRQSVSVAAIARADNSSLTGLSSDGVLRSVSASAGHPTVMVEFSHPVLIDYTVAQLAVQAGHRVARR